jgi:hypothetical protein
MSAQFVEAIAILEAIIIIALLLFLKWQSQPLKHLERIVRVLRMDEESQLEDVHGDVVEMRRFFPHPGLWP